MLPPSWPRVGVVVVVAVWSLLAAAVLTPASAELIELSYTYNVDAPTFHTHQPLRHKLIRKGTNNLGLWVELYDIQGSEHSGTHLDAPRHLYEGGWTVEAIPTDRLWRVPAVVVDVAENIRDTRPNYEVKVRDLEAWEEKHGVIPDGALVLIRTGWGKMVKEPGYQGLNEQKTPNFPGVGKGAAEWLSKHGGRHGHDKGIVGVGIDTLSLDKGQSVRYPAHVALFAKNIYGLENVANLDKLPATGAYVTVLPMRIGGGSGAPARVVAELDDTIQLHAAGPALRPALPLALLLPAALATLLLRGV